MTPRATNRASDPTAIILIITAAAVIAVSVLALTLINGAFATRTFTHPPCNELPPVETVKTALLTHAEFAETIEAQGQGIRVAVGTPCMSPQEVGLIQVSYATDAELDAVDELLTQSNGFGVPVHLVGR
ncbi:hypothetical protein [Jonesia quinghaiensis]|uniref:hypothetical protein n=1 Tax=Jonesia quinghaiensis TaxID=262806 RepID=UPI000426C227|nr:hypothetical protein [Jonesia quinghaiensis]